MVEKVFQSGVNAQDELDRAKYNDNTPVQYTFAYPAYITVVDWEKIPALTQAAIVADCLTDGFTATN